MTAGATGEADADSEDVLSADGDCWPAVAAETGQIEPSAQRAMARHPTRPISEGPLAEPSWTRRQHTAPMSGRFAGFWFAAAEYEMMTRPFLEPGGI